MKISTDDLGHHIESGLHLMEKGAIDIIGSTGDEPEIYVAGVDSGDPSNLRIFVSDGRGDAIYRVTITREG